MSKELKLRPIVAFDVDGVLRVHKIGSTEEPTLIKHIITMDKKEYPDIFHSEPKWDENGLSEVLNYFSIEAVQLIKNLSRANKSDQVWATTWQKWANTYFAPALDLPALPIAVKTLFPKEENWTHCSPAWKTKQLGRQFDGRPLIWIDDNMPDRPSEDLTSLRLPEDRALTLSYKTNPYVGITLEDVEHINKWLTLASTEAGQALLQKEYADKIAKEEEIERKWQENKAKKEEIYIKNLAIMEGLFPHEYYFNKEAARLSESSRFEESSIRHLIQRRKIDYDSNALFKKLYIEGYHREESEETPPIDRDF